MLNGFFTEQEIQVIEYKTRTSGSVKVSNQDMLDHLRKGFCNKIFLNF